MNYINIRTNDFVVKVRFPLTLTCSKPDKFLNVKRAPSCRKALFCSCSPSFLRVIYGPGKINKTFASDVYF